VIALYRGPLLEGCTEEWVLQERQSREQAYLTALEALAARTWVAGERAVAERYLRLAVAADPLRETAQRALMQALAEGGNAAAALLVYRELRLLLHRELNTVPDPETTVLFHSLRSQTRQPASAPEGETGRSVQAASDQRRSNLPVPPTALIGRERELDTVGQLLLRDEVRLVTLTGPPGTGKTRLGLEIAANLLSSFDEGARFVSLAPLQNPSLVVSTIGHSLGVRESGGRSPMESLKEYLQEKELLLLLDNFEQVLNSPAATTPPL